MFWLKSTQFIQQNSSILLHYIKSPLGLLTTQISKLLCLQGSSKLNIVIMEDKVKCCIPKMISTEIVFTYYSQPPLLICSDNKSTVVASCLVISGPCVNHPGDGFKMTGIACTKTEAE